MISSTNLLDLIDIVPEYKFYNIRAYRKLRTLLNLDTFFRNVHPSSIFAVEVNNIKIFESIEY